MKNAPCGVRYAWYFETDFWYVDKRIRGRGANGWGTKQLFPDFSFFLLQDVPKSRTRQAQIYGQHSFCRHEVIHNPIDTWVPSVINHPHPREASPAAGSCRPIFVVYGTASSLSLPDKTHLWHSTDRESFVPTRVLLKVVNICRHLSRFGWRKQGWVYKP